jgi:GNAT superfamily N-acetyltransferase
MPTVKWIKAVLSPSNRTVGFACWVVPGAPIHNHLRRSAIDFYDFRAKMPWSDADIAEMWAHVDDDAWNGGAEADDEMRRRIMGDEPHWYLASLITWPEMRGRGVGRKLMDWATGQADAGVPPTAMYLESSAMARGMYMHCGFVCVGEKEFVRRGPKGRGEEKEKEGV